MGRGIALALARKGYGLTITSRRHVDLSALLPELRAAGAVEVVPVAADMADRDALPGLVAAHREAFGSMQALVINAGVGTAGNIADFDLRRLDKTIAVNFTAAMTLIQHCLPLLRRAAAEDPVHGAKIVGLSSITGAYAEPGLAVYGASKAALLSLIETVNLEESANGVTATALAPAYVDTDMAAWVSDRVPVESMIPVDDVVRVVSMVLELTSNTVVSRIVLARSGTSGHHA
ncbi:SDR family NAD(P)-dependent oxidoreductase [Geodermatophilus sp. CPCC 205506]|uniref:SDR family NAD(P)-dependent oxidoreductase n=1 Tax=Geodermatophilus sp. CPCC 205506 TaxID=2936596 RepID=UPI003F52DDCC